MRRRNEEQREASRRGRAAYQRRRDELEELKLSQRRADAETPEGKARNLADKVALGLTQRPAREQGQH